MTSLRRYRRCPSYGAASRSDDALADAVFGLPRAAGFRHAASSMMDGEP